MARTNAQKRAQSLAAGRARQDRRREKMAAIGRPITARVDAAIVEAVSFEIAKAVLSGAETNASLLISNVMDSALAVLVDRQGYNLKQAKIAIAKRMGLRTEHRDPSFIPSLHPDASAQAGRAAISR